MMKTGLQFKGRFSIRCFNRDGEPKWLRSARNTVLNAALDNVLNVYFHEGAPVATWYMGLIDDSPTTDPGDIMTSHTGWTENTKYAGNRKAFVEAAAGSQSLSNTASPAAFVMNDTTVVAGAFLCGAATGTSCLLFCAAEFDEGDAEAEDGDAIIVIYEIQAADAGA
jgi:hypothetical protein